MCDQCVSETESWGEPLPGWFLVRATKESGSMKVGDWGLVLCNDPSYVWTPTPRPDPDTDFEMRLAASGMDDKEIDSLVETRINSDEGWFERFRTWEQEQQPFEESLSTACPLTAYKLVNGCIGAGYKLDKDGRLSFWLYHHLGMWIKNFTPLPHEGNGTFIPTANEDDEIRFDFTIHDEWEKQFSIVPWHVSSAQIGTVVAPEYDKTKVYNTLFPNPIG